MDLLNSVRGKVHVSEQRTLHCSGADHKLPRRFLAAVEADVPVVGGDVEADVPPV